MNEQGFLVLGSFSRRFSHLSVSCYNIPLIKFKVTLEILTPEVKKKKNTEIYTTEDYILCTRSTGSHLC